MSISPSLLTQGGSTVDSTSYATASVAPVAKSLLMVAVNGIHGEGEGSNTQPSAVTGLGLTWNNLGTVANEYVRLTVYMAIVGELAPEPGSVTINFPANMHACHWHLATLTGVAESPVRQYKSWLGATQNPVWSFDEAPSGDGVTIVFGALTSDTAIMGAASGYSMLGAKISTVDGVASSAIYAGDPAPTSAGFTTSAAAPRKVGFAVELAASQVAEKPVAIAGVSNAVAAAGSEISLLGGSSYSPGGSSLDAYGWTQVSGPLVPLVGTGPTRTFTAPALAEETDLEFSLVVTDAESLVSDPAMATVSVEHNKAWLGIDDGGRVPLIRRKGRGAEVSLSAVASEDGSGTATLYWSINPGGSDVEGVYVGRDGQSSTGAGPWESSLIPGLSGERVFNNLIIGDTYTLHVDVRIDGVRIDRWSIEVTPQAISVPPVDDLPGWTLLYATEFATLSDGWNRRNETQSNDNSRNIPANCLPGAIDNDKGLIIQGRREAGYNRPYTSGEIDGAGAVSLHVPSHFRAEIVGSHMLVDGLWPALLWYRPIGTNDGEIDVHEYMGGRIENQQRRRYAVTMHNEYGATQDAIKRPVYLDQLSNQDVTAIRTYVIEKTPGQIKVIVDGEIERIFSASDKAWWSRIMENGRSWYPRITLQIGDGAIHGGKTVVPEPPASWTQSDILIYSYRTWEYTP